MKICLLVLILSVVSVSVASAQAPIVIGPSTVFQWDVTAPTPAFAATLTYTAQVDALPPLVFAAASVVCAIGVPPVAAGDQTCQVPASTIPMGSHSITLTTTSGGVVSLPSTALSYVDLIIPVPKGLRFK
jgi:hypothetical protein